METLSSNALCEGAVALSLKGIYVVPLFGLTAERKCECQPWRNSRGAGECPTPGKHPRLKNFAKRLSIDEKVIRGWWKADPNSNVGIISGSASKVWVLDNDPRNGGDDSRRALIYHGGALPYTLTVLTGGGGTHEYYLWPDFALPSSLILDDGLDMLGEGHVAVGPPSAHVSGRSYEFAPDLGLEDIAPQPAPDWLLARIRGQIQPKQGASSTPERSKFAPAKFAPADYGAIVKGCAFMLHCADDAAGLPEAQWYAELGVLGRCANGEQLAHELSRPHPKYRAVDTAAKLRHALQDAGPVTCAKVRFSLAGARFCDACQNFGLVKSPITLGMAPLQRVVPFPAPTDEDAAAAGVVTRRAKRKKVDDGPVKVATTGLPAISVGGRQLREESEDALCALQAANSPPSLFLRAGGLVETIRDERGRESMREVGEAALRGRLTLSADYFKADSRKGRIACSPPLDVVRDIQAMSPARLGFQTLDGIIDFPIIRPDGTVFDRAGYDAETKLIYAPDPNFEMPKIPDEPGSDHVEMACALLDELLCDFPFVDEASAANARGMLLTPIVRSAISGPTPLYLNDAPQAGTGKSKLAELTAIIATGRPAEMYSAPKDDEELRKLLTTVLMSGTQVAVIDNIQRRLASGDLSKVLTETLHADRIFRTHDRVVLPVKCTWIGTGNNIRLGGDLPRRCCWIRLDAKVSKPFLRTGFHIADLNAWTMAKRPQLLAALLVLARVWFAHGRRPPKLVPLGSFESWSIVVGGILESAGVKGFLGNLSQLHEVADAEGVQWENFLQVMKQVFGEEPFSVADLVGKMKERVVGQEAGHQPVADAGLLRSALPDYLGDVMGDDFSRKRLGRAFAEISDRRFGESQVWLRRAGILHNTQIWQVQGGGQSVVGGVG